MLDRTSEAVAPAEISLSGGELYDAFARTRHAICKEETRYYLAGVYIHPAPDGKTLNFVATDGHRLAHVRVPITPTVAIAPVLVDPDFVAGALKLLSRKSHHLLSAKLTLSPRAVGLSDWRSERIETEPVDCTYPDYARAVPYDPPVRAILARQELAAALEPIAGFLRPTAQRAVKLVVAGETLTLSATIKESYPHDVAATAQSAVKLAQPADSVRNRLRRRVPLGGGEDVRRSPIGCRGADLQPRSRFAACDLMRQPRDLRAHAVAGLKARVQADRVLAASFGAPGTG